MAITETLLHSTVSRSGRESREMVDELDLLGSNLIRSGAMYCVL